MIMKKRQKNIKIFSIESNKLKCIVMFVINIESFKNLKYHMFLKKH